MTTLTWKIPSQGYEEISLLAHLDMTSSNCFCKRGHPFVISATTHTIRSRLDDNLLNYDWLGRTYVYENAYALERFRDAGVTREVTSTTIFSRTSTGWAATFHSIKHDMLTLVGFTVHSPGRLNSARGSM